MSDDAALVTLLRTSPYQIDVDAADRIEALTREAQTLRNIAVTADEKREQAEAESAALREQVAALTADAERYRILRERMVYSGPDRHSLEWFLHRDGIKDKGPALDSSIDFHIRADAARQPRDGDGPARPTEGKVSERSAWLVASFCVQVMGGMALYKFTDGGDAVYIYVGGYFCGVIAEKLLQRRRELLPREPAP